MQYLYDISNDRIEHLLRDDQFRDQKQLLDQLVEAHNEDFCINPIITLVL